MGRQTSSDIPAGYIRETTAATDLHISLPRLRDFRRRGLVKSHRAAKGEVWVREEDVHSLRDSVDELGRFSGGRDLHELVLVSLFRSRRVEAELERVQSLLGLDGPRLPTEKDEIVLLHEEATQLIRQAPLKLPDEEVFAWARRLFAMNEYYFSLVERHTGHKEPWRVYLILSTKLLWEIPQEELAKSYAKANVWACVMSAQKSLRHAAYFYEVERRGKETTRETLPELIETELDRLFDTYLGIYRTKPPT